jgi:hypothetical protein
MLHFGALNKFTSVAFEYRKIIMKNYRVIALLALLFGYGCKPYYLAEDFNTRTADHKTVAVLPVEMIFSGMKPEKLSDSDMVRISMVESQAFMISLYNGILRSTKRGRRPIRVDLQHYEKTLSILKENNVDLRTAWKEDPGRLAGLLNVDAVVKARVEKYRLLPDVASFGIDLGTHIISVLSNYPVWIWLPAEFNKSKEVKADYSLVDKTGNTLWSVSYEVEADWRQQSNEIIDEITRKAGKRFPYRK